MAHPLELSYNWRTPAFIASVAAAICISALARGQRTGWVSALVVVLAPRAYLLIEGSRLTVRRFRRFHTIEAADLMAVAEFVTPNGPSYRLTVRAPDGETRRIVAPVALLRGGHAALFTWILAQAPQANLDKGSLKTLARLKTRGLIP